jgi:type IV pilus assembly protein PilW
MIELMVGVAIGMFIIGGAIKLFVDMFGNNRRLLLETRVNQDLRAAADIVARDLRRAGYWQQAASALNVPAGSSPIQNPHAVYGAASTTATSVTYSYDRDGDASVSSAEATGFSLSNNRIMMRLGGVDQPLTDPATVRVTRFDIVNSASGVQWAELWTHCPCVAAGTCGSLSTSASRPMLGMRWMDIIIEGEAVTDPRVRREVRESVRLRNDVLKGTCP